MTDQSDIFKKLREYETEPPAEVMQRIFKQLDDEIASENNAAVQGYYEHLLELEVNPPGHAYLFIKNKIEHFFKLSFLQNFEIAPSSGAFSAILNKVKPHNKSKGFKSSAIIKTIYRYRSVAAVVLLVIAGWIFYRTAVSPQATEAAIGNISSPSLAKKDSMAIHTDTVNKNIAKKAPGATMIHIVSGDYNKLSVNEYTFPVADNDILSSFTAFNYGEVPDFINDDNAKRFIVKLDHYTAIAVSEGMSRMITQMNSFRRNGKLTHRAKRTRALLAKWKRRDTTRFDKSLMNNPVDPIDLADFIFK